MADMPVSRRGRQRNMRRKQRPLDRCNGAEGEGGEGQEEDDVDWRRVADGGCHAV
jgi:hypothetical protein